MNNIITYTLIRSRRKTVAIYIRDNASVEVRAPLKMPISDIGRFVDSKSNWIRSNLERVSHNLAARSSFTLTYGDKITLLGAEYPIRAGHGRSMGFDGSGVFILPRLNDDEVKQAVIRIYKRIAKASLRERAEHFAGLMGVTPASIKITSAKTRWGSCSGKNNISFSWRLVMTSGFAIDYVIVHELAHIIEHNHSPRFWAIVERILPDYKLRQKELKLFQEKLTAQNWD